MRVLAALKRFDAFLDGLIGFQPIGEDAQKPAAIIVRKFSDYKTEKEEQEQQIKYLQSNSSSNFTYKTIFFKDFFSEMSDTTKHYVYECDSVVNINKKQYRVIVRNITNRKSLNLKGPDLNNFPETEQLNEFAVYIADVNGRGEGIIYSSDRINGEWVDGKTIPELVCSHIIHKLNDLNNEGDSIHASIKWLQNDRLQGNCTYWFQF